MAEANANHCAHGRRLSSVAVAIVTVRPRRVKTAARPVRVPAHGHVSQAPRMRAR